jgi:osmoprotectant transport system permease protein
MSDFVHAFRFIGDHAGTLAHLAAKNLWLSAAAVGISALIAVPLGVWLGHIHRLSFVAINAANVGRALPSLAVIAIGLNVLGLTNLNVIVTLVVLAVPPVLTNAYVAVDGVDPDAVEAARGMGMRPLQVLTRVELPLALPLVFAGIRTASIYVVGTSTIASLAGIDGTLGDIIFNQSSYGIEGVIAAAIVIALLALLVEAGFALVQWLVTPRGVRSEKEAAAIGPAVGAST